MCAGRRRGADLDELTVALDNAVDVVNDHHAARPGTVLYGPAVTETPSAAVDRRAQLDLIGTWLLHQVDTAPDAVFNRIVNTVTRDLTAVTEDDVRAALAPLVATGQLVLVRDPGLQPVDVDTVPSHARFTARRELSGDL